MQISKGTYATSGIFVNRGRPARPWAGAISNEGVVSNNNMEDDYGSGYNSHYEKENIKCGYKKSVISTLFAEA